MAKTYLLFLALAVTGCSDRSIELPGDHPPPADDLGASDLSKPVGQACGSRGQSACPAGSFCDYGAACAGPGDESGTCTPIPAGCTAIYAPVCGCDNQTYGSDCEAHAHSVSIAHTGACSKFCGGIVGAACASNEYCDYDRAAMCGFSDAQGVCKPRPSLCPATYQPVCGCDYKTYSNECDANAAGSGVLSDGACDCRHTGCSGTDECILCWSNYACLPKGAVC